METIYKLTLADLKAMNPPPEVLAFAIVCGGDMQKFWNTCPNGDWLLWVLCQTRNLSELAARAIGLAYAKRVLPVFEKAYPNDDRPRLCLQAGERFVKHPTKANQKAMHLAAREAHRSYAAGAAAGAAYYAAFYASGSAAADYAVRLATVAAEVSVADYSFASTGSTGARKKFARWGADTVRAIIKLAPPQSHPATRRSTQ